MTYSELTLRYFETAPGAGVLDGPGVVRGAAGARNQGTWVQFDILADAKSVRAARFMAFGCPHTIAVAAYVAEQAIGRPVDAAPPEDVHALGRRFAVPTEKLGRLLIIEDAWAAAAHAAIDLPDRDRT